MEENEEADRDDAPRAVTKVGMVLHLSENEEIGNVVDYLPDYCAESFVALPDRPGCWRGEFIISCPVAPELAAGDLVDDFAPYLRELLFFKDAYQAEYELTIAVGEPAPASFTLRPHIVALLASLGAQIVVVQNS